MLRVRLYTIFTMILFLQTGCKNLVISSIQNLTGGSSAAQVDVAPVCPPSQTCYYLDSQAGNDANLGTSSSTPWQSLTPLNNSTLTPGTYIYLKAGSVFSGQTLAIINSGVANNPISILAYGQGNQPIIEGAAQAITGSGASYISITNLHLTQNSQSAILSYGPNNNWTISGCTIEHFGATGIASFPLQGTSTTGWVIKNNVIGIADRAPTIDYGAAGILLHGTTGASISKNLVSTQNAFAMFIDNYSDTTTSDANTVTYNEVGDNFSGIEIFNSSNAVVSHNKIHDGKGFGVGVGGNGSFTRFSTNALITYNTIQNMTISPDNNLYNGIDINTRATGGQMFHNTIENVYYHSITFEGDGGASSGWLVKNNIFDSRRQLNSQNHSGIFFNQVELNTESMSYNLIMSNLNYPTTLGSTYQMSDTPPYLYQADLQTYGLAAHSIFNSDPKFNAASSENLSLGTGSPAIGAGDTISGIGQVNLDLGALPAGQTSVLNF